MTPTDLLDAATLHQAIKPVCGCGHSASFDPHGLWWHFDRRGWDIRLGAARLRFWCARCHSEKRRKIRPARLELVHSSEADICFPLPSPDQWKRIVRRLR